MQTRIRDKRAQPSMAVLTLEGAVITVSLSTPRDGRCEKLGGSAHSRLCSACEGGVGRLQQQPGRNQGETKSGQLKFYHNKSVIRASDALLGPRLTQKCSEPGGKCLFWPEQCVPSLTEEKQTKKCWDLLSLVFDMF